MNACEAVQARLSAYIDGELTQQENQRVAVHLCECPACRRVCDDFSRLRDDVKRLEYPEPADAEWRKIMAAFTFKTTRGVGWLLWIGGAVVLAGYGLYEFLTDPGIAALQRVGVLAVILGIVLVFLTVLIERVTNYQHDRYKDVEK